MCYVQPNAEKASLNDATTPVPEWIHQLKVEIARLSAELNEALADSVYLGMSASQLQVYDEKCKELKKFVQKLAQLDQLQNPPAFSSDALKYSIPYLLRILSLHAKSK